MHTRVEREVRVEAETDWRGNRFENFWRNLNFDFSAYTSVACDSSNIRQNRFIDRKDELKYS